MPGTYFGPYAEQHSDYANGGHANVGRWPLGHTLVLPDGREYKFTLNDGTVEAPGENIQVALDAGAEVTFSRNRSHQVTILLSPPPAQLSGVSPGVAAADRFYWSQVKGYAAVLANLTLLAGLPVQADI